VTQVAWSNIVAAAGRRPDHELDGRNITLKLGSNVLTITARDAAGNIGTATMTAVLTIDFTFTDDPLVLRARRPGGPFLGAPSGYRQRPSALG